jgi:hypothetical protein
MGDECILRLQPGLDPRKRMKLTSKNFWQKRDRIIPFLYRQWRNVERWLSHITGFSLHSNEKRLIALKNRYLRKRCFIVGNGPSLTWHDLDLISKEKTFASNKIYLSYANTIFRPTFYTVIDSYVFENNQEEISQLTGLKLYPHYLEEKVREDVEAIFFRSVGESLGGFGCDPVWGKRFFGGYTVVFTQLQLAWYMGFREIYLIGMDHTWNLPENPIFEDDGNYKVLTSSGEINHFHPDYRKPGEKWTLPQPKEQEIAFKIAREYIEGNGGIIKNGTRGGKLEIFERVDLDKLVEA